MFGLENNHEYQPILTNYSYQCNYLLDRRHLC
ncbi:hypothetical protein bas33_0009 [Escherichia phage HildyBeyeler]|uniref:Uncharacterized protein n=1 Tax=Escherichia phage HildyBeyeler TaxID=2852005 RepID=A0AAE7VTR8_9CAUD|nr:hypothetical protein bas33_0009 [Escherichia phage HildyBeyeler]